MTNTVVGDDNSREVDEKDTIRNIEPPSDSASDVPGSGEDGSGHPWQSSVGDSSHNTATHQEKLPQEASIFKRSAVAGRRLFEVFPWTPPACRYDPDNPPKFSLGLNLLFSFVRQIRALSMNIG